ncbi:hypothetical protein [Streptomyces hygroscopicus]|uniref:hypothetical protein n=1 Tax=Streptomyces hygroscopicus TaxID=1912 RepID=UPI001F25E8CB|nr:hypothetical protein [Streptomyces hygroscopicus]
MTGFPGREDDYRSRREGPALAASMTAGEDAVSFEDRGRAAIRASSQYLADPSTLLEDAHAAIKLLQLVLVPHSPAATERRAPAATCAADGSPVFAEGRSLMAISESPHLAL